ncbi:ADP-ribosylglycohydrolase family protein [Streptosporangium sp. NBC_01495]|uniref:ADP-ribosylglycohydrolase family protein n=1 Tax=Streptosporangium sp. NBC_01495 TaxID=2903899 RepID=UPI002E36A103|nr:ADP-ribosylglycohydrolase family protein [Streptosporangium sp. NBC_01495]
MSTDNERIMPVHPPAHDPPNHRDRVRGCLLGGALGDALGAPVEFESIGRIRREHGPEGLTGLVPDWRGKVGLITDDTQMTLFTVEGLIRGNDVAAVRRAYLRWLDTQQHRSPPPASPSNDRPTTRFSPAANDRPATRPAHTSSSVANDRPAYGPAPASSGNDLVRTGLLREQEWLYSQRAPGNACLSGLRASRATSPAPFGEPGPINPDSKGCGTVMRSAPFGLGARSPRHAFELAAECAQITHGHPTGYLAAGAFAAIVHFLAENEPAEADGSPTPDETLARAVRKALDLMATYPSHEETSLALRGAVSLAAEGGPSPEKVESLGGAWVAEEALAIAVYCALTHPAPGDVERALLLAVNHSGDSDSTGAVCGNLLGTLHGEAALPAGWLARLEGRDAITELADDFAARSAGNHEITDAWLRKYPGA